MKSPSTSRVIVTLLLGVAASTSIASQKADETLSVNDPRPLAEAVKLIEQRCGCPITYEDPVFAERDTIDISGQVATNGSRPLLVPAGGVFTFTTQAIRGDDNSEHVSEALRRLLDTYSLTGFPGKFRVTQSHGVFHVAPEQAVLDTPITIRLERVSASQAIDTILAAVKKATGANIGMGGIASNLLNQQRVSLAVEDRTAAETLTTVFAQVDDRALKLEDRHVVVVEKRLSWQLFYQIGWGYALNLHAVPRV